MDRLRDPRRARSKGRYAWARLNADALFLALLAIGSGIFTLIDPSIDRVTSTVHAPSFLHYVQAGGFILTGALLLAALLEASVRLEVLARHLLVGFVVLSVWRHAVVFGIWSAEGASQVVLLVIVYVTMRLRLSVLLGDDGLVVTRPAKDD